MARAGSKTYREKGRKDVLIKAPPGIWPPKPGVTNLSEIKLAEELTPQDVIQMQAAELAMVKLELKKQMTSAATIARFAICMIRMFQESTGHDVVRIPKELYDRMNGAEIQIAQPSDKGGDVFGRYVERSRENAVVLPTGAIR